MNEESGLSAAERYLSRLSLQADSGYGEFRKTSTVFAVRAEEDGFIDTLEGPMEYKSGEHYIVSDNPPTHVWPVRADIFERTYEPVVRRLL